MGYWKLIFLILRATHLTAEAVKMEYCGKMVEERELGVDKHWMQFFLGNWFNFRGRVSLVEFFLGLLGVLFFFIVSEGLHQLAYHAWLGSCCPSAGCDSGFLESPYAIYRDVFQGFVIFGKFIPLVFNLICTLVKNE